MDENENIYVKIQIEKNVQNKKFILKVQFDQNAPNFTFEKNNVIWTPTEEEINFIIESFEMITRFRKNQNINQSNASLATQEQTSSTHLQSAFDDIYEKKKSPPNPLELDIVGNSETTTPPKERTTEERMFVQADEKTIDEIIKKKNVDYSEGLIVESDEREAIDRVLKQKMKKK
ncbi:MAG: hypothetical protein QXX20_00770 [Candidatus Thermoplasmatota archaeon]